MTASSTTPNDEWVLITLERLLSPAQLDELRAIHGESYWQAAVRRGWTTDEAVLAALATRFRMRIADVDSIPASALAAVSEQLARRYRILPLAVTDTIIEIATANPYDIDCERTLAFVAGRTVRMSLASPTRIAARIDELYRPETVVERLLDDGFSGDEVIETVDESADVTEFSLGQATDRPIIRLVDRIISKAIQQRASDIHLEPEEQGMLVRYRIDGVLKDDSVIPRALSVPLVARVKIMAQLDIADRLRPQDGRARVSVGGARIDLRISTLPTSVGEKVVIRILDARTTVLSIDGLGLSADESARIATLLSAREGLILVTGPTGSGKTTTLYSMLRTIQLRSVNIITVEDPVEYRLKGVVQVNVNEKTGLTFPAALRSILRQDPDVILVGEVRDKETAQIAVQAALTGHLVLTTLHTIDAASSVTRLTDLGIDPYRSAAALKGIVAQRLVRKLCAACRRPSTEPVVERLQPYFPPGSQLFKAVGCSECSNTGYLGRLALLEILTATPDVERRIAANETPERIAEAAREHGMLSLWESGVQQVASGFTTLDELLRVLEVPAEVLRAQAAPPTQAVRLISPVGRAAPAPEARPSTAGAPPAPARPVTPPTAPVRGAPAARPPITPAVPPRPSAAGAAPPSPAPRRPAPPSGSRDGTLHGAPGAAAFDAADFELVADDRFDPPAAKASASVLLVEDEAPLRRVVRDLLVRDGFTVHEAVDGVEALDAVDREAPDIIVLDLNLPRLDGYGVLKQLRAKPATAALPVIVLTAKGDEDSEVRVFEFGATEYLTKPFRPRALIARLRALLRR